MENIEQILQKLVAVNLPPLESDKVQHLIQHAFETGKAEKTDPLEGYSNLTEAIESGPPIDYEKLDGLKVLCVNPDVGNLRGVLTRRGRLKPDSSDAWWDDDSTASYINALYDGWRGKEGWTLWVEGEVPLRRKTADQLDYYTYFYGYTPGKKPVMAYVGGEEYWSEKRVHYAPSMGASLTRASEWVVLEEYGTSPKPEGK